jgi:hypothetical protein
MGLRSHPRLTRALLARRAPPPRGATRAPHSQAPALPPASARGAGRAPGRAARAAPWCHRSCRASSAVGGAGFLRDRFMGARSRARRRAGRARAPPHAPRRAAPLNSLAALCPSQASLHIFGSLLAVPNPKRARRRGRESEDAFRRRDGPGFVRRTNPRPRTNLPPRARASAFGAPAQRVLHCDLCLGPGRVAACTSGQGGLPGVTPAHGTAHMRGAPRARAPPSASARRGAAAR